MTPTASTPAKAAVLAIDRCMTLGTEPKCTADDTSAEPSAAALAVADSLASWPASISAP
jgi:hypothetical protein